MTANENTGTAMQITEEQPPSVIKKRGPKPGSKYIKREKVSSKTIPDKSSITPGELRTKKQCIHKCGTVAVGLDEIKAKFPPNPSCTDGFGNVCIACRKKQKKDAKARRKRGETLKLGKRAELVVIVDFNRYPDVYIQLAERANKNSWSTRKQLIADAMTVALMGEAA